MHGTEKRFSGRRGAKQVSYVRYKVNLYSVGIEFVMKLSTSSSVALVETNGRLALRTKK